MIIRLMDETLCSGFDGGFFPSNIFFIWKIAAEWQQETQHDMVSDRRTHKHRHLHTHTCARCCLWCVCVTVPMEARRNHVLSSNLRLLSPQRRSETFGWNFLVEVDVIYYLTPQPKTHNSIPLFLALRKLANQLRCSGPRSYCPTGLTSHWRSFDTEWFFGVSRICLVRCVSRDLFCDMCLARSVWRDVSRHTRHL